MSDLTPRPRLVRRLVLGAALALGFGLVALLDSGPTPADPWAIADAAAADLVLAQDAAPKPPAAPEPPAPPDKAKPRVDTEITIGEAGVVIRKPRDGRRNVDEFDSFDQFVEQAPWLAAMVFGVTALVLLVPILVIALVIWYKIRSNRMRNETMLRLAERGVVPPAEAMAAVAAGTPAASLQNGPSTAPLYDQARQIRNRVAWSDLRKGIILGGIGLGLSFYSMLSDGDANALGLVLLFVGIGYIVLWYFEGRQGSKPADAGPSGGD